MDKGQFVVNKYKMYDSVSCASPYKKLSCAYSYLRLRNHMLLIHVLPHIVSLWKQALILRLSGWVGEWADVMTGSSPDKNLRLTTFQPTNRGQDPLFLLQIKPHSSHAKLQRVRYWPCFERPLEPKPKTWVYYFGVWHFVGTFLQYPGQEYFENYQDICLHSQEIGSQFKVILTERRCMQWGWSSGVSRRLVPFNDR